MIKVDDRFSFERDKYNWILHETRLGKDKQGNDKEHTDLSFHGTLKQVCMRIIDLKQGDCESLIKLMDFTSDAVSKLADEMLEKTR